MSRMHGLEQYVSICRESYEATIMGNGGLIHLSYLEFIAW